MFFLLENTLVVWILEHFCTFAFFPKMASGAAVAPTVLGPRTSDFHMAGVFEKLSAWAFRIRAQTWNPTSWGREIGPGVPARRIRPKLGALQGQNFLTWCDRHKQLFFPESLSPKLVNEHICQKMATYCCFYTPWWSFFGVFSKSGFLQFFANAGSGRGMIPGLRVSSERASLGLSESVLKPEIGPLVAEIWRFQFSHFGPFWNGVGAKKFDRAQLLNQSTYKLKTWIRMKLSTSTTKLSKNILENSMWKTVLGLQSGFWNAPHRAPLGQLCHFTAFQPNLRIQYPGRGFLAYGISSQEIPCIWSLVWFCPRMSISTKRWKIGQKKRVFGLKHTHCELFSRMWVIRLSIGTIVDIFLGYVGRRVIGCRELGPCDIGFFAIFYY